MFQDPASNTLRLLQHPLPSVHCWVKHGGVTERPELAVVGPEQLSHRPDAENFNTVPHVAVIPQPWKLFSCSFRTVILLLLSLADPQVENHCANVPYKQKLSLQTLSTAHPTQDGFCDVLEWLRFWHRKDHIIKQFSSTSVPASLWGRVKLYGHTSLYRTREKHWPQWVPIGVNSSGTWSFFTSYRLTRNLRKIFIYSK